MNLLVVGASGGTGRALVLAALAAGHRVRAWSREAWELGFRHPKLDKLHGDVRDPSLCAVALHAVDAVVSTLGSVEGLRHTTVCSEGTKHLTEAMQRRGLRRLVAVTSLGTTAKLGPVHKYVLDPLVLRRIYDDKRAQERLLEASSLDWTIVRPGRLTDGPDLGTAVPIVALPLPGVFVGRRALARFLLHEAEAARFVGCAPYLVEPMPLALHRILTLGADAQPV